MANHQTTPEASFKPLTVSSTRPNAVSSPSGHGPDDPQWLLSQARQLFACYRRDEATDPEVYTAAVAAVLGDGYSRDVVEYCCDPRTGLPSTQKFLPNIAEIRTALDARAAQIDRAQSYDARVAEQTRLTEEWRTSTPSERLKAAGDAWVNRTDPSAQELTGQKPRKMLDAAETEKLLESAKQTGKVIGDMTLSEEATDLLKLQEKRYGEDGEAP